MTARFEVTRREFLQSAAALVIWVAAPRPAAAQALPESLARNPDLDTWLRIGSDGTVAVFSGKCELGQGIRTALAQVVADELDVAIERIRMATVDTAHSPNEGRTVGSNSVPESGSALRVASAEARRLLLENASRRLGVAVDALTVADGRIAANGSGNSVTYWEVLAGQRFDTRVDGKAESKDPALHRYVGMPQPRLDLPAKFFGEPAYIHDLKLPGMRHARVVRGEIAASELVAVDAEAVRDLPGVVGVVRNSSFLAVVAEREEQAVAAAEALRRTARWRAPAAYPDPGELPALLRRLPTRDSVVRETRTSTARVARQLEAEYSRPFIAHASLAPSAALAHWDGATLTVWSHAQGMYPLRAALAEVVGLPPSQIRCIHAENAGCYGHNGADDAACDAALIALASEGTPIRLVWSRLDEFRYEPYGSAMSLRVSAGLDAADRVVDWRYDLWSCSHSTRPGGGATAGNLLAAREKSDPLPLPPVTDGEQPTGGADRNSIPLYDFPNQRVIEHLVLEPPLRASALRGLGAHGNIFAIESFMDELALAAGADPYEFRLRHLADPRARAVIEAGRGLAARVPEIEGPGRAGRGVAFARYKNSSSYLAVVAEVEVDERTGSIRLRRAFAAVDVGQAINPDGIKNQIEGGIVQAASWTLKEQVKFSTDRIESADWATYPILGFAEVPDIEVIVIDRPELESAGAGEAAQGPTAAAIANAVADAVGARLRDLPLTPARVLAALSG